MKPEERFRRKIATQQAERQRRMHANECLQEVIASFKGTPHNELFDRINAPVDSRKICKGNRTYTVDVNIVPDETAGAVRVVFTVDDGGLYMSAPDSTWILVRPNERLEIP
jgi:hypothetical protein